MSKHILSISEVEQLPPSPPVKVFLLVFYSCDLFYNFSFFSDIFKNFKLPQFWPLQPKCWLFLSCCLHNFFYCFRLSEIYELWCFWPLHYKFSFYLSIRFWLLYLLFVFTFPFISNFWIITFWPLDLPSYRHIVLWPLIERSKNNMFIAWEVKRSKKEVKTINCKNAEPGQGGNSIQ